MSKEHSQLFKDLSKKVGQEFRLDPIHVEQGLRDDIDYERMSDLLRENNDAQFGIVSTLDQTKNEWVRDATNAVPLEQRISHDAPVIYANNALLRCLSRLRPIDYAIEKKHGDDGKKIRSEIKEKFADLTRQILDIAQTDDEDTLKKIEKAEREFNTFLVQKLHEANLTHGCENEKDAEKLLFHYRNLSSVLSPARTMVTLTYDKTAKILQRETQYPVTIKTDLQKETVSQLKTVVPYPFQDEKNAHTSNNIATQEADSLFADLIIADDRAMAAQARKTHLVGAKNAFIVKNELIAVTDEDLLQNIDNLKAENPDDVLWLARMGSPVFVGKAEKNEVLQAHTRENLEQVRLAAAKLIGKDANTLNLHVTTLNTDSPQEKQSTIIDHVYKATRERENKHDNVSYAPTNSDGVNRALDIADGLNFGDKSKPSGVDPLRKASRLESVASVMLAACNTENTLSVVHCASGQDRTGTAVEKATQEWMKERYQIYNLETSNIDSMRAEGGNAAEITTHHIHGSPGMKTESMADNFLGKSTFSPNASKEFYLHSANTNKKNKVGDVDFLQQPSQFALEEYQTQLAIFEMALKTEVKTEQEKQLAKIGQDVLNQIQAINTDPKSLDAKKLSDLTLVLSTVNKTWHESSDVEKSKDNAKRLAALANHVNGQSSPGWKALGITLLTFACVALVIAGVLAAIPSGGTSLLMTTIGIIGFEAAIGAGVAAGAAAIAGPVMIHHGREKGLANSVRNFKQALHDLHGESIKGNSSEEDSAEHLRNK